MGINNAGTTSVYAGVHTQGSSSICHGVDVFVGGNTPPDNSYIIEDASQAYITEDALSYYVTEA